MDGRMNERITVDAQVRQCLYAMRWSSQRAGITLETTGVAGPNDCRREAGNENNNSNNNNNFSHY